MPKCFIKSTPEGNLAKLKTNLKTLSRPLAVADNYSFIPFLNKEEILNITMIKQVAGNKSSLLLKTQTLQLFTLLIKMESTNKSN